MDVTIPFSMQKKEEEHMLVRLLVIYKSMDVTLQYL